MVTRCLCIASILAAGLSAQAGKPWSPPRTPEGHPDLQGNWSNATITPFERPAEFAGKEFFTPAEAEAYAKRINEQNNRDRRGKTAEEDVNGAYNELFFERGTKIGWNLRTSIVIDPPDGRVPPLTPAGREAAAARAAAGRRRPERAQDFALPIRCLLWGTAGPPMISSAYNNNYQIVQTRDSIVILSEMIHDARIIAMDGRPHISSKIRQWLGDSIGRWDGDTLVVDTTNFGDETHFRGADRNLHVIERFVRTGPETMRYQFTIDDPSVFTRQWTGEVAMTRLAQPIYEYACHEGNYSMPAMLSGARMEEAEEARKNK